MADDNIKLKEGNLYKDNNNSINISSSKTDDYTILDDDSDVFFLGSAASANKTFTLPSAGSNTDREITIINNNATYSINVDGASSETINGVTDIDIENQYCGLKLKSDGSNWIIISTIGDCEIMTIGSAIELIYRKYYTGTTDADSNTAVTHGLDNDKIVGAFGELKSSSGTYNMHSYNAAQEAAYEFAFYRTATAFTFNNVGANSQSQTYHILAWYYI